MNTTQKYFTIKEMLRNIEQSNKINHLTNNGTNYVLLQDGYNINEYFSTWKQFKKYVNENFIDDVKNKLLNVCMFDTTQEMKITLPTKFCTYTITLKCI